MSGFRFGVIVRRAPSRAAFIDQACRIEDLGYAVLGVPDHLGEVFAPMPALAVAAAATRTLRLATTVLNNDLRHPVLVAREAATLDLLTDGRLELGLGAGYARSEYDQAGLPFDRGRVRVERLAESVTIVKRLLGGEPLSFAGQHYHLENHAIYPPPVQRPHPPILIGGNGGELLALAAREADIVGLTGIAFRNDGGAPDLSAWRAATVDERVRLVREAAGDRHDPLELNALVQRVIVTGDRRAAADTLAREWTGLTADEILETPYALLGTVDQMVECLLARRERWGISYVLVHQAHLEACAPVVARLAGR